MKKILLKIFNFCEEKLGIAELRRRNNLNSNIFIEDFFNKYVINNPKYADKKLNRFEYNIYSQSGEDGIIEEIFKRIGVSNKFFVEFGVSNGLENNTASLLLSGWRGRWLEGSSKFVSNIKKVFEDAIIKDQLRIKKVFVTAENIEEIFEELNVPKTPDLLSIDIDGNDYWVWKAIKKYDPRVVVIEYNPFFGRSPGVVSSYDKGHIWDRTMFYGSSLKAMEKLGKEKGYSLVGCNFTGNNAFFVKNNLIKDLFSAPYTSENHYEPNRIFLIKKAKYGKSFGKFEIK